MERAVLERGKGAPRLLGDLVQDLLKTSPWSRRTELSELTEAWELAAGVEVARRSRVLSLSGGILTVNIESAVLRHEIEGYRKREILQQMKKVCPDRRIAALRCVLQS